MGNEVNKIATKFKKKGPPPKKVPTTAEVKTFIMIAQNKLTLFRNKKVQSIKTKRKEIVNTLKDNNLDVAKSKMSTIIGDEDIITVYDILGPILDILKEKVTYLMTHDECPSDLQANLDTVIYSSSRLEVEELIKIRELIRMKYGDMYISKGDSNADNLVNKNLIEKLKVKQPSDTVITIRLKQLCKEEKVNFEFPFDVGTFDGDNSGMGGNPFGEQQNFNPYASKLVEAPGMGDNQYLNNQMGGFGNNNQNNQFGNFNRQIGNNNPNQMNQGDFGNFGQHMGNNGQDGFGQGGFGQMNQNPYGGDVNFGRNQQNKQQDFGGFGGFNNNQQFQQQIHNINKQNDFPPQNNNTFGQNNFQTNQQMNFGNNNFPQDNKQFNNHQGNFQNNPISFGNNQSQPQNNFSNGFNDNKNTFGGN